MRWMNKQLQEKLLDLSFFVAPIQQIVFKQWFILNMFSKNHKKTNTWTRQWTKQDWKRRKAEGPFISGSYDRLARKFRIFVSPPRKDWKGIVRECWVLCNRKRKYFTFWWFYFQPVQSMYKVQQILVGLLRTQNETANGFISSHMYTLIYFLSKCYPSINFNWFIMTCRVHKMKPFKVSLLPIH